MGLNIAKGNMYSFITHTWNTVKGQCPHDCTYCYMKRFKLNPIRFDKRELKTDLGKDNFIFVGSSCDMFANSIPDEWIYQTIKYADNFNNKYLYQTKNPKKIADIIGNTHSDLDSVFCTTIETNKWFPLIMKQSPKPLLRAEGMENIKAEKYVTIEPIMDFDLLPMIELIKQCSPIQVNVGADSGNNHLPEPTSDKIGALIKELKQLTRVELKPNLRRLYPSMEK
jgi:DNA repair photolyase